MIAMLIGYGSGMISFFPANFSGEFCLIASPSLIGW